MHKGYKCLSKLEIELKQLEKTAVKPAPNRGILLIIVIHVQIRAVTALLCNPRTDALAQGGLRDLASTPDISHIAFPK